MNAHSHKMEPAIAAAASSDQIEDGESVEVITQKFDMDSFQPELHSGFKPIYPADGAPKPPAKNIMEKSSPNSKKDDSIEALIYEDSEGDSEENDTENSEMTTSS